MKKIYLYAKCNFLSLKQTWLLVEVNVHPLVLFILWLILHFVVLVSVICVLPLGFQHSFSSVHHLPLE